MHDIVHVKATKAPEIATTGATTGGVTGGVLGLLAGVGALAIPCVGPFIAAGPIMAALSGAAIGATTGGVVGCLIGLGIPEMEAKRYEGKLKSGNYLIDFAAYSDQDFEMAQRKKHPHPIPRRLRRSVATNQSEPYTAAGRSALDVGVFCRMSPRLSASTL